MVIAALAYAGKVLEEPRYVQAAAQAADFILTNVRDDKGALLHRWRAGNAAIAAQLEDYTSMVWGLTELYEAGFDSRWLAEALKLNAVMLKQFKGEDGGFYQVGESDELIARPMEIFDSALPSGNAVAMHNLLRLSRLTGDAELAAEAAATADHFAGTAERAPSGVLHMLSAVLMAENKGKEIVLVGDRTTDAASSMLRIIRQHYRPNAVVLWHDAQIEQLAPFTKGQKAIEGKVTAYVCEDFQCNLPTNSMTTLKRLLQPHSVLEKALD